MASPDINHRALRRVLAITLADHTTWDSPPRLYTIHNPLSPRLETDLNPKATGLDIDVADLLTALADACYQTHLEHPEKPLVGTGFVGVALRAEGWGVGIDADPATAPPIEPFEGPVRHHPDRVETASIYAVTTDDMFHTLHWIRGAPRPRIETVDLTNQTGRTVDGRLVWTLRRLMRIIRHHQPK